MDQQEFHDWFEKPIEDMIAYEHGGFAVLMIAIPLAERLFRERSGCAEGDLSDLFYDEFIKEFHNLNRDVAKQFWHVHRNGLLHQAAFSLRGREKKGKKGAPSIPGTPMPGTWITSLATPNAPEIINYDVSENEFLLKPRDFARRIVEIIKADWPRFEAPSAPNHPFPRVAGLPDWADFQASATNPILGQQAGATGVHPGQYGATGTPGPPRPKRPTGTP